MSEMMKSYDRLDEAELMRQILEVRYTDLEEERRLCKKLLEIAQPEGDTYESAFANVYLVDSSLALGDYAACDFYLMRAEFLCRDYGYDELLMVLCNFAGLYFLKLSDEQTALQYYLEGLRLARKLGHYDEESKLLNNIGIAFGGRGDWEAAVRYFTQAFEAIEPHLDENNKGNAISYLSNRAEAHQCLGQAEASKQALDRCESLGAKGLYHELRLVCGWCNYYAMSGDRARCVAQLGKAEALGLLDFENKYFAFDMGVGLVEMMVQVEAREEAGRLLEQLLKVSRDMALFTRYHLLCVRIKYLERFGTPQVLEAAYREYYDTSKEMTVLDDQSRAQSMLSRIQLTTVQLEREAVRRANRELENTTQLDELTGLYNRRYFNKLVTKVTQSGDLHTLGFVMLDVDYFKQYNDNYGHFMGDTALKAVGSTLSRNAPEGIYVSRYGGDEFVCLCANLSDRQVADYVERVRADLAEQNIPHEKSQCPARRVTLSMGYCNEPVVEGENPDVLLQLADRALYRVKEAGRNNAARVRRGGQ